MSTKRFNPLFVGEVSSSGYVFNNPDKEEGFQSPLRRGSVFIFVLLTGRHYGRKVSIPSSSGKCLHPSEVRDMSQRNSGFNPLFVAEVSSSQRGARQLMAASRFQSPLRRGSVFIASPAGLSARVAVSIPSSSGKCLHLSKITLY